MGDGAGAPGGATKSITVLGLGNVLMGDDALGPYVVETLLAGYDFEEGVSVIDAGTPGLDLTPYAADVDAVVIVDAIRADGSAGELLVIRGAEALSRPSGPRLSPHDPGLAECLLTLELAGRAPGDVCLLGAVVSNVEPGVGLTEPVQRAVPALREAVLGELARLGKNARPRETPEEPNIWWERP